MNNKKIIMALALLLMTALCLVWRSCHRSRMRNFDARAVADAETEMWKAYYAEDHNRLGLEMMRLLREQHGMSLYLARKVTSELGAAAMRFRGSESNYGETILPQLTKAYTLIKRSAGGSFDPGLAAEAELAWWVARRTPGRDTPETVGEEIAKLYTILYGESHPSFTEAGVLRARAAAIRDEGGEFADWTRVNSLLRQSYGILKTALNGG
jgi:hypothetical protein